MRRYLLGLVLLPAMLAMLPAAVPAGEVKIRWRGQSMFEIWTSKGTKIVTDPNMLEAYRVFPNTVDADLVLMSHLHTDHTKIEAIKNHKDAKKVRQFNAVKKAGPGGLQTEWNVVSTKVKDVRIQSVRTYHDQSNGTQRGKNGVWIIDVDGLRIVHLGDLGHQLNKTQLRKITSTKVDVLMIPVGGVYTLNGIDAYKVVQQIKPTRWVLPMHYGTIVYDDLLPLKTFQDEVKDDDYPIKKFKEGQWLTVNSKDKTPKKWTMGVLHYLVEPVVKVKAPDKGKDKKEKKDKK